jgi:glyoxylase-like metal-dependent hydrolase (beta-lactamase superfamily II)
MLERDVAPGIHRVEDAFVNFYVVEDGGRLTVVDAGHPLSWRALQDALDTLGHRLDAIDALVLTHGHFDHVGFAKRAHDELGVPVHVPRGEEELVDEPWDYEHEEPRLPYARHPKFLAIFTAMGAKGALLVKGLDEVVPFEPDAVLDVPGRPRAVATPGHTHAHSALLLADRDAVIAGDAVVMLDPYTGREGPCIVAGAATADSEQALASLGALAQTGAQHVLTGHGPAWHDGAAEAAAKARAAGPA